MSLDRATSAIDQRQTTSVLAPVILSVEDLEVAFGTSHGSVRAVAGVTYDVRQGEIVALVGESGCGKSVSSLAIMGLLSKPAGRITGGRIIFDGRDLTQLSEPDMRAIRGRDIAMIFQEPMTSLNPVLTVGFQIMEPLFIHLGLSDARARARAIELLELVGITDPVRRLEQFPHQLSGGMRQRIMIAIGLACNPKLIIADEPTTALDVTIQAQILELMKDLSRRLNIALVIITHNLGVVARYADRVNIMYAGKVVEKGTAIDIFTRPRHPYTLGLMRSVPRLDEPRRRNLSTIEGLPPNLLDPPSGCRFAPRCAYRLEICEQPPELREIETGHRSRCFRAEEIAAGKIGNESIAAEAAEEHEERTGPPLLAVRNLTKRFHIKTGGALFAGATATVTAVNEASFEVRPGETLGLVGESGSGKTTVGRLILNLETATEGEISFEGTSIQNLRGADLKRLRRKIQVIFQDPFSSLNPRMTIGQTIEEPMNVFKIVDTRKHAKERVAELLERVGLYPYMADRYPHQLSGGQRQRVGIARALAMEPKFIVCDEPVSALDVSVQGQIINLLQDIQQQLGVTYLFIAHDLAVVRHISTRVAVMYLGRIVEIADRDDLYQRPLHPYTRALLDAAPVPDPIAERMRAHRALIGELPSPLNPPRGCVFNTRCPLASEECRQEVPAARTFGSNHVAACHKI